MNLRGKNMLFRVKIKLNFMITIFGIMCVFLLVLNTGTAQNTMKEDSDTELYSQSTCMLRKEPQKIISQSPEEAFVEVTVFDAATSLPLEEASVTVTDEKSGATLATVSTNEDGFANITLNVGSFKLTVSKAGDSPYQADELFFDIDVLGEFKQFNVFLVEQRIISGGIETTLVGPLGNPVASALVNVHNSAGTILTSDYTNDSGIAVTSIPLNKGTYTLNASAPGFYSKNTTVTLSWHGDIQKAPIVLYPKDTASATIEIRSIDAITEENLSYVNIEIFDSQGISKWTGTTDEDGLVILSKLDMGTFTITAYFDTYNEVEKEIFLHYPGAYKKVTFSLFPTSSNMGYIEVIAVNQEQTPISGASVALYDAIGQLVSSGSTHDDGQHNLTGLAPGSYKLRILDDLYHLFEQEVTIRYNTDKQTVEAILTSVDEFGSINVDFSDINGELINTVLVKLYSSNGELLSSQWTENTVLEFKDLQLGVYKLVASKRGLQPFQCEIDLFENYHTKINPNLLPSSAAGSFDIQTPLNAFILVYTTEGDLAFSGSSGDSEETTVSGLPLGDYCISIFTPEGEQSFTQSINWVGDNQGISWQDMIDITDNSSCMEFTIWDIEIGLVEGARVDVFFQNGILAGYGDTDSSGFVNITGLFLGQYEVVVSKYGYRETVVPKTISYKGQKLISSLYIYQAKGHIHVYITEIFSGDPYPAYVRYRLDYGGYWGDWSTLVRADTNGYIAFHNIPMGNYNVSVMSGYYENQYQAAYINFDGDFENLHFALTLPGGDGVIDHYALIVAGGDEQRFTHDAALLYNTLWMNYGYSSSDMILLTPHANDPVTGDPVPRSAQTSATSVEWAINQLASMADGDDQVVILWTGHGHYLLSGITGDIIEGRFQTHDDEIGSIEFDSWVDGIFCNDLFIFLGPCFSGYWIGELNDEPNRAIYTSCRWDENGWATDTHSYWPWGINRALNPNLSASSADDNNNGGVSLYELYEWVDHYVRVTKDANQHPQRFVGNGISYGNDQNRYIGDGTYNAPLAGSGSLSLEISQLYTPSLPSQQNSQFIDSESGLAVIMNSGMDHKVSFEIYNSSLLPEYTPLPDIQIVIRDLFGEQVTFGLSNSEGYLKFEELGYGYYVWEVLVSGTVIFTDEFFIQNSQFISYAFCDNYDFQGDAADVKIQVADRKRGINFPDALITLYHADGQKIDSLVSNEHGAVIFFDQYDGLYGYEITLSGEIIAHGTIHVKSSEFTLASDNVDPEVKILSPTGGEVYKGIETLPRILYSVEEANNYTLTVYVNGMSIGYVPNGSILSTITQPGIYTLKVEAIDKAENIGFDSIEISINDISTTTSRSTSGFTLLTTLILISSMLGSRKSRK